MIETNRNILSDAIRKMPVRKPKASGWSAVSDGLDQVEAEKFISETASKLPHHKAPAATWSKIAAALPPPSGLFINSFMGRLFLGSLIGGVLIIAVVFFSLPEKTNNSALEKESSLQESIVTTTPSQSPNSDDRVATASSPIIKSPAKMQHLESVEPEKPHSSTPRQAATPPVTLIKTFPDPIVETEGLNVLESIKTTFLENDNTRTTLEEIQPVTPTNNGEIEYAKDLSKAEFKAGIFYAFKRYQKIEENGMEIPQNQSSVGLELLYKKDKWFFKSGLAYVSWEERGDYTYDYDQNQLVYQYNYVDSTYINPNSGSVTYFTTETFVYDSVEGQQQGQASYDYQMLQIPLVVGYRLLDRKNFSIGILGGVGFDIRLAGKQFVPAFSQDGSTVKEVNNSLKYRTANNWRLLGGLELGYAFARKWELYAEPTVQWYMKPLYSPDNTNGLGLLNIKFGIRYIF